MRTRLRRRGAALEVIDDAAGGADDDLRSAFEVGEVVGEATAAHEDGGFEAGGAGEEVEHGADLLGELAGWGEDDGLAFAEAGIADLHGRQAEGDGLTSAGLGLTDDIAAVEQQRDGLLLDWGRLLELERGEGGEHAVGEIQRREGCRPVLGGDLVQFVQRRQVVAAGEQRLLGGALRGRRAASARTAAVAPAALGRSRRIGLARFRGRRLRRLRGRSGWFGWAGWFG